MSELTDELIDLRYLFFILLWLFTLLHSPHPIVFFFLILCLLLLEYHCLLQQCGNRILRAFELREGAECELV